MAGQGNRTTPAIVDATLRQARAIELRREGKTYDEIARELGYSEKGSAHRAVTVGMKKALQAAGAEDLRAEEVLKLDRWEKRLEDTLSAADKPHEVIQAVYALVNLSQRRGKLLGLDQAQMTIHAHGGQVEIIYKNERGDVVDAPKWVRHEGGEVGNDTATQSAREPDPNSGAPGAA